LKDVPDALEYLGLVVLKLPNDDPKTELPVVMSFVRLQSLRNLRMKSRHELGLGEILDELVKVMEPEESINKPKKVSDSIKPLQLYRDQASKTWWVPCYLCSMLFPSPVTLIHA
jgi:hypothetical protein